jgi:hypothetical protein
VHRSKNPSDRTPGGTPPPDHADTARADVHHGDGQAGDPVPDPQDQGVAAGPAPDPFDPASLRLSQDFTASIGVKKLLHTVPVRTPDKTWFVRVHPRDEYSLPTGLLDLKEERETYLVAQSLWPALAAEPTFGPWMLFTAISRQGVLFLWKIRLPGPDGKMNPWWESALAAAQTARRSWVRVQANMQLGAFDVFEAKGPLPDPDWPEASFRDLLAVAFKNRRIDALDHPVLRKLRGEV